jgi:hypothetical protein
MVPFFKDFFLNQYVCHLTQQKFRSLVIKKQNKYASALEARRSRQLGWAGQSRVQKNKVLKDCPPKSKVGRNWYCSSIGALDIHC